MSNSVSKKVNFINWSQNEWLSPSCKALSFDGFDSISWHSIFFSSFTVFTIFRISKFFGLCITEEIWLVEMCTWCIKIGILLDLHFNPWVEDSGGGLLVSEGLFSLLGKYFGIYVKIRIWCKTNTILISMHQRRLLVDC
jgi:hypothetical protein